MRDLSAPAMAFRFDLTYVKVIASFAAVYLLWGATYLAVALAIETLPPFFMMAIRSLIAGGVLFAVAVATGCPQPGLREWRATAVIGVMFFAFCHGVLAYAQQRVPSGMAALLMATIPLWVPVISWTRPGGHRPSIRSVLSICTGFAGVGLLLSASGASFTGALDALSVAAVLFAAISWAIGSVASRELALPSSPIQSAGMQLLIGGALLLLGSAATGEFGTVELGSVSLRSWLGLSYLIVLGSLVGFSAYVFLLGASKPERVATYAYVNPVVAVVLGWTFLGEPVTGLTLLAASVILTAVAITVSERA